MMSCVRWLVRAIAQKSSGFSRFSVRTDMVHPRAVDGALFVAELSAACLRACDETEHMLFESAVEALPPDSELRGRLITAGELARSDADVMTAGARLGTGGFVLESVPFAAYCFLSSGPSVLAALGRCVEAGGDTDSNAAILGAWLGARRGASALPRELLARLQSDPFGENHLRNLAAALLLEQPPPAFSWGRALCRNLTVYPVVLAHALRRMSPI